MADTEKLTIYLPAELLEKLLAIAGEKQWSLAHVVRDLLTKQVEKGESQ